VALKRKSESLEELPAVVPVLRKLRQPLPYSPDVQTARQFHNSSFRLVVVPEEQTLHATSVRPAMPHLEVPLPPMIPEDGLFQVLSAPPHGLPHTRDSSSVIFSKKRLDS